MRTVARSVTALVAAFALAAGVSNATRPGVDARPIDLLADSSGGPKVSGSMKRVPGSADIRFGTAIDAEVLASDKRYATIAATEFNSVTAENAMKWESVEPAQGRYDWSQADEVVEFAEKNDQAVRGHTQVWHSQMPKWLTAGIKDGDFSQTEVRSIMKNHVIQVTKHFKGKISQWDVVNEAFTASGTQRYSLWREYLGKDYIAKVFRWAHEADPQAKLFYNDFGIEGTNPKSDAVYDLLKRLKAGRVPVDGVGLQAHLGAQYAFPDGYRENLKRFAALGLEISLTEVDVRIKLPVTAAKVATQTSHYEAILKGCLAVSACSSITLWGFDDRNSWVPAWFDGQGSATPFDTKYKPKPVWSVIRGLVTDASWH
jgi:endo-1,4-beta-xylanase